MRQAMGYGRRIPQRPKEKPAGIYHCAIVSRPDLCGNRALERGRLFVELGWLFSDGPMKIAIIIPAFNEEKLLPATLRSIQAALGPFSRLGWETELVVCDNNSTDRTSELARAEGAAVVFEPVNQIARARNAGAAAATGDWLIFVDADSQPSPELFADVATEIQRGECLAGGSTVRLDSDYFWYGAVTRLWNALSRWRRYLAGSFIFCEAKAFREVGGFSQELFAAEELDLSLKLLRLARQTGRRIVVLHRHPLLTSARKAHLYSMGEHLRFLGKTVLLGGRTLKRREGCPVWYDGRR
jgi:glycosyltransferase involved in cell wall biosynthesis